MGLFLCERVLGLSLMCNLNNFYDNACLQSTLIVQFGFEYLYIDSS